MSRYNRTPIFNLQLVVHQTGLTPDTLRAWEKRYNFPQPDRTSGGHRLYSEYDIETLKWLLARKEEGMSIGRAVALW
ncbi:MAG TPA: MerR family transcriptional regulator, partial [Anaerolineae bacterium]|nr:MerR family transcriptional regulator [Anaerolineae bacterium]